MPTPEQIAFGAGILATLTARHVPILAAFWWLLGSGEWDLVVAIRSEDVKTDGPATVYRELQNAGRLASRVSLVVAELDSRVCALLSAARKGHLPLEKELLGARLDGMQVAGVYVYSMEVA